ncbi:mitochondrial carrier domain-containing protein [Tuber borchii]|uniref:Mitochondrial aspartate-glutamate transporter AGC1 n=1 Tax=Tuber borchii TaxID=42251 RepID=A0A2T6ZHE5_TUBBO|nr:mitochondrial carrier domain-containing protein [Tuber borchii]
MATATPTIKESLLGIEHDPSLTPKVRANFTKFASITEPTTGERFMTRENFIDAIAPPDQNFHKIKRDQYAILFDIADRRSRGVLNIQDWATFEDILAKPDAEYQIAFRLFDVEGSGSVKYDDFVTFYTRNKGPNNLPFDWASEWASLYLGGKNRPHSLSYPQFSQMLRGLQDERVRQAFRLYDKNKSGYIESEQFQRIILETSKHKLSDHLLDNLHTLSDIAAGSKISYANVRAFQNVVREMDTIDRIVQNATAKSADGKITRTDFMNEAAKISRFGLFSPMETDIIFHFAGLNNTSGKLSLTDFARVLDSSWREPQLETHTPPIVTGALPAVTPALQGFFGQALDAAFNFALGSVAGAFGATIVYPIDLVKTRMQNQRSHVVGELMYKNSIDCAKKVIRNEGFRGLYSGLGPQLIGVAPEKAIKLTVNDLVRSKAKGKDGEISLPWEVIAGGSAGGCQVVFTNPLEIVKIRLQVQGEVAKTVEGVPRRSALWIVKNLGLVGLYKGASACLLRDVPFSAIYFPTYSHLKKNWFGESPTKKLGILQLLISGAIAGMPAAYLTTPCDVIKTRLQVEARKGQTHYRGLVHCASTIWREEGLKAFYKGGAARVLRSSPQFGFTLAAYEVLQTLFYPHGDKASVAIALPTVKPSAAAPLPYLRSRNALKLILDIDENFGHPKLPQTKEAWGSMPSLAKVQQS